jgi:carboxyl-terminal processing protease
MRGRVPDANRNYADTAKQRWPDLNLIALVDGRSASAAEIVAGALQDHDRAVIVGTPTYGKGSAQSVVSFGPEGGLKLTTARWFTPAGRSIARQLPNEDDDEEDATPAPRLRFRTDAGRVVYGGGGITPDVVAGDSSVPVADGNFIRALGANTGHFRDAVTDYALYVKGTHAVTSPDFSVTPAMLEEVWKRMKPDAIKPRKSDPVALQGTWRGKEIGGRNSDNASLVLKGSSLEFHAADNEWYKAAFPHTTPRRSNFWLSSPTVRLPSTWAGRATRYTRGRITR